MKMRPGRKTNSPIRTFKALERRCRSALFRELAPRFGGTRATLRRAIRRALHTALRRTSKRLGEKISWMLRVVREARFAALVAGTVVAGFGSGPVRANPTIQLSNIAAGAGGFEIKGEATDDFSGSSVSGAGDVNGDGLADLIIGAYGAPIRMERSQAAATSFSARQQGPQFN